MSVVHSVPPAGERCLRVGLEAVTDCQAPTAGGKRPSDAARRAEEAPTAGPGAGEWGATR